MPGRDARRLPYTASMRSGDSLQLPFEERRILSVSGLNREAKLAVEGALGVVWVEGEISNLSRPSSGHLYWSLKDAGAQVRCAMFRMSNRGLGFELANGQQILVRGRVSLYEARGEYQLIVEYAEEAGEGLLRR
jgi:exodeoxyribonuclease VII large subunit